MMAADFREELKRLDLLWIEPRFLVHTTVSLYQLGYPSCLVISMHSCSLKILLLTYLLTHSMVQSPSWAANWFAASQEIPRISPNPKVHYRTLKRPPPVSILDQPNPVHIPTSHLLEIQPNIIHPSMPRSPQWSLSLQFSHQDPIHPLSSPIRATCPAQLILLDFITCTILGEEFKSFSSSLCNLLHSRYLVPPRSKYSPQHQVLKHPQLPFLPQCQRPSFTPMQINKQNYSSIYLDL